ncbi:MAG: pirin family protein [Gemmatimonadota bacterium]
MTTVRAIRKVWKSRPTVEGAGVHLKRAFGFDQVPLLDPFLLLDDFHSADPARYLPGFPWHPHRGIETITYVLQGTVEHGDSMNNRGVIAPGDVQWMTAGSGIIHQEMPKGDDQGRMWGFQLWANLPAAGKMMDPRYREVKAAEIPEAVVAGGARVKVVCGRVDGARGPVRDIVTDPEYLDVAVPARGTFSRRIPRGRNAFAYVVAGAGYFDPGRDPYARDAVGAGWYDMDRSCLCRPETLVHYGDGDEIAVAATEEAVRFLLVSGRPIGEPVAWYGPVVMNTREELRTAFEEYAAGTFLRHR